MRARTLHAPEHPHRAVKEPPQSCYLERPRGAQTNIRGTSLQTNTFREPPIAPGYSRILGTTSFRSGGPGTGATVDSKPSAAAVAGLRVPPRNAPDSSRRKSREWNGPTAARGGRAFPDEDENQGVTPPSGFRSGDDVVRLPLFSTCNSLFCRSCSRQRKRIYIVSVCQCRVSQMLR